MAQDEYFLALAQMFTQGQARAAESSRMVAADLREQARYEDEKPFREARLNEMLTAGKRAEVGLEAEKYDFERKKELAPFNLKEAQDKATLLEENIKRVKFSNRPDVEQAELDTTLANATAAQARANIEKIQAEDAADPVMRQYGKDTLLHKFTAAKDESELARFNLDEAKASAPDRKAMRELDIAEKRYEAETRLPVARKKKLDEAHVLAEQIRVLGAQQDLQNGETQGIANFLDIANKTEAMDQRNAALFKEAVTSFIQMKALALANDASPEAMADFERSTTQVIALATKLSKTSPELAAMGQRALYAALKGNWASMDTSKMTIDQRLDYITAHNDAAADGFVVALTREQGGPDSRPDSRPGDAALGGMLTGGADSKNTPPPQEPQPRSLSSRVEKSRAEASRKEGSMIQDAQSSAIQQSLTAMASDKRAKSIVSKLESRLRSERKMNPDDPISDAELVEWVRGELKLERDDSLSVADMRERIALLQFRAGGGKKR